MRWKDTPSGPLRAAEHLLWGAFGQQADSVAEHVNRDPGFRNRIARFVLNGGMEPSVDVRVARALLGNSLIDLADWALLFGTRFEDSEVQNALQFPWHEDVIMSECPFNKGKLIKDTHTAFFGLPKLNGQPLTVAKWIELQPATGQPKFFFNDDPWHADQPHIEVMTLLPRWYLLLTEVVPGSTGMTPDDMDSILPAEYEPPSTIAEVTKNMLVYHKTGRRPNYSKLARCAELTIVTERWSDRCPSLVGIFSEIGLSINGWSSNRFVGVGCGASRKLPPDRTAMCGTD